MDKTVYPEDDVDPTLALLEYLKELSQNDELLDDLLKRAMKDAGHTEVVLEDGQTEKL